MKKAWFVIYRVIGLFGLVWIGVACARDVWRVEAGFEHYFFPIALALVFFVYGMGILIEIVTGESTREREL